MKNELIVIENEKSLKDFFIQIKTWYLFLKSKWLYLTLISLMGGVLGYAYSKLQPINYVSKITFIIEENKSNSSSLGGIASLAGQFGVDISNSSGGNVLSGDNILLYFKSPTLAREVLLSKIDSNSNKSIADYYVQVYGLNEKWKKDEKIANVHFEPNESKLSYDRLRDSLLHIITNDIITKQFLVNKVDKKASFIEVTSIMRDEKLSKIYCERIVQRVVERYVNMKIERQKNTVDKLQLRVDSISSLLYKKTLTGATIQNQTNTMDINPLFKVNSNVATEATAREKALLSTIFASVTQNLELAKFTLSQETPVIQIIDSPILPLKKEKVSGLKMSILFSSFFFFGMMIFFVIRKLFNF
jgi:hypothetical protein